MLPTPPTREYTLRAKIKTAYNPSFVDTGERERYRGVMLDESPFFATPTPVREMEHFRVVDLGLWRWTIANAVPPYAIRGKYVFLSRDQLQLEKVAEREILHHGFHRAKVSRTTNDGDYVLCLYYEHERRGRELALRAQGDGWACEATSRFRWTLPPGVTATTLRFRWWKSELATEAELQLLMNVE